jgi:hypothetical protein
MIAIIDNEMLWRQLGAAIDMLRDALRDCPDKLWEERPWSDQPDQWVDAVGPRSGQVTNRTPFDADNPFKLTVENLQSEWPVLADQSVALVGDWGPLAVMMGIYLVTGLLTEVISNAAAAVLAVPIAIDAALSLGASPHAFVMAIVIAASTSFLMSIGHQVNVLVFGPGGYRFADCARVGVWLNLVLFILTALILPPDLASTVESETKAVVGQEP